MCRACVVAVAVVVLAALSAVPGTAGAQKWYEKAVKKVDAKFVPAEAKPGETVTFALTVELNEGYYTYPTAQPDPGAAGMVNVLKVPKPGAAIFVGAVSDGKVQTKAEPELGIKELRYIPGTATYAHKVVVSPESPDGKKLRELREQAARDVSDVKASAPPTSKWSAGPRVREALKALDEISDALK